MTEINQSAVWRSEVTILKTARPSMNGARERALALRASPIAHRSETVSGGSAAETGGAPVPRGSPTVEAPHHGQKSTSGGICSEHWRQSIKPNGSSQQR